MVMLDRHMREEGGVLHCRSEIRAMRFVKMTVSVKAIAQVMDRCRVKIARLG
jgi:hypothetical protein